MNEKNSVPYIAYESEQARYERTTKRLIIALTVAGLALLANGSALAHVLRSK